MLLSLTSWLQSISPDFGFLSVFQYLTFRAVMAAMTALLIGLVAGPSVLRRLTELKIGQAVTVGFGAIGGVDDWRNGVRKDPEGMRSREKYFWQSLIGLVAALYLVFSISESSIWRVLQLFYQWVW